MKKIILLIFFSALTVLVPNLVLADGMIVPPPNYYMFETDQKAVIFYENNLEDLIISITFRGNAQDFAWIIPTPSRPQVTKSSDELFTALDELTSLNYYYDQARPMELGLDATGQLKSGVTVIETKQIDYYDITVLAATNANDLYQWLNNHGYKFPDNATYILDDYIKEDWYFTAVKVDSQYLFNNLDEQFRTGHAIPFQLSFTTNRIVYPLKISSTNVQYEETIQYNGTIQVSPDQVTNVQVMPQVPRTARYPYPPDQVDILLYVFASHKQELPQFNALYAGWVEKDKIEKLAYDDSGNPWKKVSGDKYYLTKLQRQMRQAEMTSDLFLRQAANDQTVNAPQSVQHSKIILAVTLAIGGVLTLVLLVIIIYLTFKK